MDFNEKDELNNIPEEKPEENPSPVIQNDDSKGGDFAEKAGKFAKKAGKAAKKAWPIVSRVLMVLGCACASVLLICVVCGFVFMGVLGTYLQEDILPASDMDMSGYTNKESSYLYYVDENGEIQILQKLHSETQSQWVNYEDIPEALIHATMAIEDHRFSEHQGVDWVTTIKACARMFFGDDSVGGSSITQQLVKNVLLPQDDTADDVTVRRKVMEIFRAVQLEKRYDKKTIIEYYLNCIYLGQQCEGVRSAAAVYFGKEVEKLTIAECASLISITNSPTYYDPYQNYDNNMARKENVLWAMRNYGWITESEYQLAMAEPIVLKYGISDEDKMTYCPNEECGYKEIRKAFTKTEKGEYYCPKCGTEVRVTEDASEYVYSWYADTVLEDVLKALVAADGAPWNYSTRKIYLGQLQQAGYHIYTCLDMNVQKQVDKIYSNRANIPETRGGQDLQSAIVVIDNRTGDIVALSGGAGEKGHDDWNRTEDATLQSGSSIKPLSVYAPAFENGTITPASVVKDLPQRYDPGAWPRNADNMYAYARTVLNGVIHSVNAVAANTLEMIGTTYGYDYAKNKFRLTTLVDEYVDGWGTTHTDNNFAPLAMGAQTWGVTVRDMASAYATFANNGVYRRGRTFTKIYDRDGNLVLDNTQFSEQILSEKTVNYMNYCLVNATQSGTGYEADMSWSHGITTAGKTGSTADYKDRWYCGFTGYYTAAVWCGFDDPAVINLKNSSIGNPASYLWKKVMGPLHSGKRNVALYDKSQMVSVSVCLDSGLKATEECDKDVRIDSKFPRTNTVLVYKEDVPTETCDKHVAVDYCSGGGVATEYCKHFAEVDATVEVTEKSLVKMTLDEIQEILKAKNYRLLANYVRNDYVYLINKDGKDGNWKGFDNKANADTSAPYVVCTKHTKEAWEKYQAEHVPDIPSVIPPIEVPDGELDD